MDIVYVVYKEQYFIYDDKFETTILMASVDLGVAEAYMRKLEVPGDYSTIYYVEAVKVL